MYKLLTFRRTTIVAIFIQRYCGQFIWFQLCQKTTFSCVQALDRVGDSGLTVTVTVTKIVFRPRCVVSVGVGAAVSVVEANDEVVEISKEVGPVEDSISSSNMSFCAPGLKPRTSLYAGVSYSGASTLLPSASRRQSQHQCKLHECTYDGRLKTTICLAPLRHLAASSAHHSGG